MKTFQCEIMKLENEKSKEKIINRIGKYPIILTSVHSMNQFNDDKIVKLGEPLTKAITQYIANKLNLSYLIKVKDDGIDPNHIENEEFKYKLLNFIKENNIRLVLDIHGASEKRDFDVELGTMNNLSADFSTINELKEAFIENGIKNIAINDPFKGGKITQYLYMNSDIEIIQIEINRRYRDINSLENTKIIIDSIINFLNQYINIIDEIKDK